MSMLVWLTLPFYDFCGFRSAAVNTVYKLQFFYIYMRKEALWGNLALNDDRINTIFGCLICHFLSFYPNVTRNPA